jgi:hypothetical protein
MREKMKKLGLSPPTVWQEKPIYISSTGTIIDQYVPPEGDGKASLVSAAGAKQVPVSILPVKIPGPDPAYLRLANLVLWNFLFSSVADPEFLYQIPIFSISDPGSRV